MHISFNFIWTRTTHMLLPTQLVGQKKKQHRIFNAFEMSLGIEFNGNSAITNIQRANSKRIFCNRIYLKRLKPTQMMNTIQEVYWIRMNERKKNSFQYFTK